MGRTYWEIASTPREFKVGEEVWFINIDNPIPVKGALEDEDCKVYPLRVSDTTFTKRGLFYINHKLRSLFTREEIQELGLKIEVFHPVPDWIKFIIPPIGGDLLLYSNPANAGFILENDNYRRVIVKTLTNAHLIKVKLQEVPYSEIVVGDWYMLELDAEDIYGEVDPDKVIQIDIPGYLTEFHTLPIALDQIVYKIVTDED